MVAEGPRPGRTPISVPMRTPKKQYSRFVQERATEKPNAKFCGKSIQSSQ